MPPNAPPADQDAPRDGTAGEGVSTRRVARLWAPLAASWWLMSAEGPLLALVVARLPEAEVNLAAWTLVFAVSLVIEGPIIMLLAASTALCSHWDAYLKVRRFMLAAGAALTATHGLVAFTPLYDLVARDLMGVPDEVLGPGRLGLQIMTPWTWAIAYRRFQQGVLIRFEQSDAVGRGTALRLVANASVLGLGYAHGGVSGIVVGGSAVITGVLTEALYVSWRVRPVLRDQVRPAEPDGEPLTLPAFLRFYVPLALTPLITLIIQPLGAAAMSRMPNPLLSLAAWTPVHGLVFMSRGVGMAYNEVVVSLLGRRGAVPALRRFSSLLALATMAFLVVMAATPLAGLWFETVNGLTPELARLCRVAVALSVLMPGYAVLQSWYQGTLVRHRTTRPITEAVLLYMGVAAALLWVGIHTWSGHGISWALGSFVIAGLAQTAWLRWRSREAIEHYATTT